MADDMTLRETNRLLGELIGSTKEGNDLLRTVAFEVQERRLKSAYDGGKDTHKDPHKTYKAVINMRAWADAMLEAADSDRGRQMAKKICECVDEYVRVSKNTWTFKAGVPDAPHRLGELDR